MSSRFVSAGQIDAGTGDAVSPPRAAPSHSQPATTSASSDSSRKQAEWAAVQAQLDAERRQRDEAQKAAATASVGPNGEQSLYDVLQANKAAKQAAFEEANRIRNQFRALDDDEIEFLDGVRETRRQEEEQRRAEMEEGLRAFREAQAKEAKAVTPQDETGDREETTQVTGDEWAVAGRKRKRDKEKVIKGIKRRTSSTDKDGEKGAAAATSAINQVESANSKKPEPHATGETKGGETKPEKSPSAATSKPKPKAGLVDYGSDDDSD